jgi:hypothetical protein
MGWCREVCSPDGAKRGPGPSERHTTARAPEGRPDFAVRSIRATTVPKTRIFRQFNTQRPRNREKCMPNGQMRRGATITPLGRHPPNGPRWNPGPHPPATRVRSDATCESTGAIGSAWALKDINAPNTAHAKENLSVLDMIHLPSSGAPKCRTDRSAVRSEASVWRTRLAAPHALYARPGRSAAKSVSN